MEPGPDASVCNLLGKGRHVGPTMGNTRGRWACHRDLWNVIGTEHCLDDTCDAAAQDAVRTRVFRVRRRVGERLPRGLTLRGRVAVDIAVTDGRDGSPEVVVVLGI